jgi:hypothetical protein
MRPLLRCLGAPLFLLTALSLLASASNAQQVYSNDFSGAIGSEWSINTTDITPVGGRRFLGQFSNQTVNLSLSGLPSHNIVTLNFDLFVIRSWDGNQVLSSQPGVVGPDLFTVSIDGSPLLTTSFSNIYGPDGTPAHATYPQAYPGTYPSGNFLPRTGATEVNTLGYQWNDPGVYVGPMDSVYHLTLAVPHSAGTLTFGFNGAPNQIITDESWGIDNVQVSVGAAPEPATLAFALFGSLPAVLGTMRRRQRPAFR